MTRIAIIGGGAAGMMVAATLAEREYTNLQSSPEIHIFEKNKELGTKVRISGGGRCNVTTGYYKKQDLISKYTRGREFISHAMSQFGPRKMMQRCAEHDCPIYCQDDMRCFPESNKGSDVVTIFERILQKDNIHIHFSENCLSLSAQQQDSAHTFTLTTSTGSYEFDVVVITTGGNAYGHTGSTGDGYSLAMSLGHTVTALGPSLNSFLTAEEWIKECSGISFQNATLSNRDGVSVSGPLLFTHFGISGPVTFSYSSHIPLIPINFHNPHTLLCHPYSDYNRQWWTDAINKITQEHPKKQLLTFLCQHFSARRCESFCKAHDIDSSRYLANLSRDEKNHLANLLGDGFPITLTARRPGDEFVTAGGVNTDEVNPKTMESLVCPGLYFAGEVLNIDAVTGGFNFQSCWATGRAAGTGIKLL